MSQTTKINITDGSGAEVLSQINTNLSAFITMSSGATEPVDKLPFMLWADTTAHVLKIRRSDNTGWISLGLLDTPQLFYRTGAAGASRVSRVSAAVASVKKTFNKIIDFASFKSKQAKAQELAEAEQDIVNQ